jgi:hypothetical protein
VNEGERETMGDTKGARGEVKGGGERRRMKRRVPRGR